MWLCTSSKNQFSTLLLLVRPTDQFKPCQLCAKTVSYVPSWEIWLKLTKRSKVIVISQCTIVATCFFFMPFGWKHKTKRMLVMRFSLLFWAQERRGGGQLGCQKSRPSLWQPFQSQQDETFFPVFFHTRTSATVVETKNLAEKSRLEYSYRLVLLDMTTVCRENLMFSLWRQNVFSKQEAADYLTDIMKGK